jgi:hypothetical protein
MSAADHTPIPLSPERLAEIESLLQYESSISFHSAQARESMLLVVAEVARLSKRVAELEQFEIMNSRRCERGVHADWLVDSENTHQCPWCRIAELEAEVAHVVGDASETPECIDDRPGREQGRRSVGPNAERMLIKAAAANIIADHRDAADLATRVTDGVIHTLNELRGGAA